MNLHKSVKSSPRRFGARSEYRFYLSNEKLLFNLLSLYRSKGNGKTFLSCCCVFFSTNLHICDERSCSSLQFDGERFQCEFTYQTSASGTCTNIKGSGEMMETRESCNGASFSNIIYTVQLCFMQPFEKFLLCFLGIYKVPLNNSRKALNGKDEGDC